MGFFNRKQKQFAQRSYYDLQKGYKEAEDALEKASYTGSKKALKAAMKEHQKYEYALLYRNTPEYRSKEKKCR